jgi:hypothetical protein
LHVLFDFIGFAMLSKMFGKSALQVSHKRDAEERAFVRRLDIFFMTFGCISQSKHTML